PRHRRPSWHRIERLDHTLPSPFSTSHNCSHRNPAANFFAENLLHSSMPQNPVSLPLTVVSNYLSTHPPVTWSALNEGGPRGRGPTNLVKCSTKLGEEEAFKE